jgi:ribokinase
MFVIIGTTTADLLVASRGPLDNPVADGFRASNVVFSDTPLGISMGGNGGNSAYVAAGLGLPTMLVSSVGNDPLGDLLAQWLEARGVDTATVSRSGKHATSTSVILLSDQANQVVVHHRGANAGIRLDSLTDKLIDEAAVLLATSFSLVPDMRSGGLTSALTRMDRAGGTTALDVGPAIGDPVTLDEIVPLLRFTRYLIGNSHELTQLTGSADWETAAAQLRAAGARNVVIKRGAAGASLRGNGADVDLPGFAVKAGIPVGAGDAFNVGFLCGVQRKLEPARAIRLGNAVAAMLISSGRGVMGSPNLAAVEKFLAAG